MYVVKEGDVVTVYDKGHSRGLWGLGKIESCVWFGWSSPGSFCES